jgi:cytosolic iron-sulfur protein assembly protein CIAO1
VLICDLSLLADAGDNAVRVFASKQGDWNLVAEAEAAHEQDVNCVAWHPNDPTLLASCSDDGFIKLWRCSE